MKLQDLQHNWNALGEEDPLWAILSAPDKRGGMWDLDEFLATGPVHVTALIDDLRARGIELGHGRALDFGCGIGRLTQALAEHFELCDGVDLAPSMIEQANRINRRGDRCRFHHNPSPDLGMFGDETFDFALSLLVFQHMAPELMRGYVAELVRVLRPGGVAYFNVPDHLVLGTDLPRDAARAFIGCRWDVRPLRPSEVVRLPLTVHNRSALPWPASARLRVGNHWLAADGTVLTNDDARALLDEDVAPGAHVEVELAVLAPDTPGRYQLEMDVVQEHKGWFATLGSQTLRIPVEVTGAGMDSPASAAAATEAFVPTIEMYAMPRDEMLAIIQEAGGVALEVIEIERCGPSAPSFDYVVGRSPERGAATTAAGERSSPTPLRPASRTPGGLWEASARLGDRSDVWAFDLSSRRRALGSASVGLRRLMRRALREVLYRQTEFNHAASAIIHDQERQLEELRAANEAQAERLAAANRRIELLERIVERDRGEPQPPSPV